MPTNTASTTRELALDHVGILAITDGMVHYLTQCCRASAKGSVNSPTGVCCRNCYRPVDAAMGGGWMADDAAAWLHWVGAFTADAEAAHPANVGNPVLAQLTSMVQSKAAAA
jgi:hypothetical protein